MYCPQCGQQQVSSETRFCSRCGLPLNLIGEVVIHGGTLPQLEQVYQQSNTFNRSAGLKFGLVWFLVMTFLLTPIFAVLDWDNLVALSAILGFIGGILIMVFSMMFLKNNPKEISQPDNIRMPEANPQFLRGKAGSNALPPPQTFPATDYVQPQAGSWRATEDLQPATVTEETTKLLKEEDLK
ncbi:MAG: hypothetical protein ABIP06_07190 [Pyrinomonadaceae bacterium]